MISVSIAEVERLWKRFQQLGCNVSGMLTEDKLKRPELQSDAFVRNVRIPRPPVHVDWPLIMCY